MRVSLFRSSGISITQKRNCIKNVNAKLNSEWCHERSRNTSVGILQYAYLCEVCRRREVACECPVKFAWRMAENQPSRVDIFKDVTNASVLRLR